jgi:hypothetical protein
VRVREIGHVGHVDFLTILMLVNNEVILFFLLKPKVNVRLPELF